MSIDNATKAEWDEIARKDIENINQLERFLELYKDVPSATAAVRLHRLGLRFLPEMLREQGGVTTESILRVGQILSFERRTHMTDDEALRFARAIEQAVLQSPEIQELRKDAERLDWLSDPENNIGNVQLPIACVENNLHSLRGAIDEAMEQQK